MATAIIESTKDYSIFKLLKANRGVSLVGQLRRNLYRSMQNYGFIDAFPIICQRRGDELYVIDGQTRLAIAKELGLAVFYTVMSADTKINIPELNNTSKAWEVRDYAEAYAKDGKSDYQEVIDFAARHHIALSAAVGLLGNTAHPGSVQTKFRKGTYCITTRALGERVATLYTRLADINSAVKTAFLLKALFAFILIPGIEDDRLIGGARRKPEWLIKYGDVHGYLHMIENLYNFGRSVKFPVQIEAVNVMQKRNMVGNPKS